MSQKDLVVSILAASLIVFPLSSQVTKSGMTKKNPSSTSSKKDRTELNIGDIRVLDGRDGGFFGLDPKEVFECGVAMVIDDEKTRIQALEKYMGGDNPTVWSWKGAMTVKVIDFQLVGKVKLAKFVITKAPGNEKLETCGFELFAWPHQLKKKE